MCIYHHVFFIRHCIFSNYITCGMWVDEWVGAWVAGRVGGWVDGWAGELVDGRGFSVHDSHTH